MSRLRVPMIHGGSIGIVMATNFIEGGAALTLLALDCQFVALIRGRECAALSARAS